MQIASLERVRSFLVPVDGSQAAYQALAATCDVARRTHATVSILYVIEVPRQEPVDVELPAEVERGERILSTAEEIAKDHHIRLRGELLQARQAGLAVVDEAVEKRVDAIVVGLEFHRPFGRFEMGRLPEYVVAHAPCEVWLLRLPATGEEASAPAPSVDVSRVGHLHPIDRGARAGRADEEG